MQVEAGEQLLFDDGRNAVAEEEAVGEHNTTAPAGTFEQGHDVLEEEDGGFGGTHTVGEVVEDAPLLLAAERWISSDHVYTFVIANLADIGREGVMLGQVRVFDAVQQHIHYAKQVGHGLLLDADQ